MTFREIQDDTLERCTFDSSGSSSSARTRIKRFINEIYRRIARTTGIGRITTATATISTVASQTDYVVTASQVRSVYCAANGTSLSPVTLAELRIIDPESSALGRPTHFAVTKVGATTLTLHLYPTPTETLTLDLDTGGLLTALSGNDDVPVLPIDFHYLLGTGARMLEAEKMQAFNNYKIAKSELDAGARDLRLFLARGRRTLGQAGIRSGGTAFTATATGGTVVPSSSWIDGGLA